MKAGFGHSHQPQLSFDSWGLPDGDGGESPNFSWSLESRGSFGLRESFRHNVFFGKFEIS